MKDPKRTIFYTLCRFRIGKVLMSKFSLLRRGAVMTASMSKTGILTQNKPILEGKSV